MVKAKLEVADISKEVREVSLAPLYLLIFQFIKLLCFHIAFRFSRDE